MSTLVKEFEKNLISHTQVHKVIYSICPPSLTARSCNEMAEFCPLPMSLKTLLMLLELSDFDCEDFCHMARIFITNDTY